MASQEGAIEFATFLVDHIDNKQELLVVAYRLLNSLGVKFTAYDAEDVRNAVDNLCDWEEKPLDDEHVEQVVVDVMASQDWKYMDPGYGDVTEEIENMVRSTIESLGLWDEEEEDNE